MSARESSIEWVERLWRPGHRALVIESPLKREQRGYRKIRSQPRLVRFESRPSVLRAFEEFAREIVRNLRNGSICINGAHQRIIESGYSHCLRVVTTREQMIEAVAAILLDGNNTFEECGVNEGIAYIRLWHEPGHARIK